MVSHGTVRRNQEIRACLLSCNPKPHYWAIISYLIDKKGLSKLAQGQAASQQQFISLTLLSLTYHVFMIHPLLIALCNVQNIFYVLQTFFKFKAKEAKASMLMLGWITFWLPALRTAERLQGLAFPQACFQAMEAVNSALNACCVFISSVALYPG